MLLLVVVVVVVVVVGVFELGCSAVAFFSMVSVSVNVGSQEGGEIKGCYGYV